MTYNFDRKAENACNYWILMLFKKENANQGASKICIFETLSTVWGRHGMPAPLGHVSLTA